MRGAAGRRWASLTRSGRGGRLARGESLGEAIRIMFASKEERRRIAARKFPGRGAPPGRVAQRGDAEVSGDAVAEVLDAGVVCRRA